MTENESKTKDQENMFTNNGCHCHDHTKPCCSFGVASIISELDQNELNLESSFFNLQESSQVELPLSRFEQQQSTPNNQHNEAVKLEIIDEDNLESSLCNEKNSNLKPQNTSISDISPVLELAKKNDASKPDSAFDWNNFLVRRACFRGVHAFFKSKFSKINTSWQRKRVNKTKKIHMHLLVKDFAIQEFGQAYVNKLSEDEWVQFRSTLYSILFSHRYKKNDDFLEGINFELVRNVLYSYTTETRVELMSNPFFSLMILHFLKHGKKQFIDSKVKGKPELYAEEVRTELESLNEEAIYYLKDSKFFEN